MRCCSALVVKIAERYCVPTSGPWAFNWVGLWATEKKSWRIIPTCASSNNMGIKRGFTPYPLHVSPFWRQCRDESALLGRFAFAQPASLLRDAPRAHRLDAGWSIREALVVRTRSMGTGGCDGE